MEDRRATVTDALQSTTFRLYSSAAAPVTGCCLGAKAQSAGPARPVFCVLSQGASHWNAGLQPLLHAHVVQEDEALERQSESSARSTALLQQEHESCASRAIRRQVTRSGQWGSRSQTHRRAAKGGFTQTTVRWSEGLVPDRCPPPLFLRCSEKL